MPKGGSSTIAAEKFFLAFYCAGQRSPNLQCLVFEQGIGVHGGILAPEFSWTRQIILIDFNLTPWNGEGFDHLDG